MLYGCEDGKALKWMAGSDIIWMKRKYGLPKGCVQNEWNFKVEILVREERVAHISASIAMVEAMAWAGGSNRQLRQTSPFSMIYFRDVPLRSFFFQPSQTMSMFQPGDFPCIAKTRLVPTFIKLCSRDKAEMLWLPALQLLVLRNLCCSFVSLYPTTFS